ncbi:ornithine carbamoyltransferase [Micromonospora echinofusca]|uniref:Ornithine carbamoyltransferase n=1 Tax=Micromonospora echinofusca TaxID=47858 RepID=A0ABS3VU54_MICEH|nr:ornithine carbamoyltransferase [Micromonospora echinofusca]MBO4208058.1 ornithine carbamoyltransferase [Micromonospora echinofusca]
MDRRPRRHLLSIRDLSDADLRHLVARSADFAAGRVRPADQLRGLVTAVYFRRTSTRTRTAFSSGALRLGSQLISYGPGDLQLNTGETIEDTARVLSRMVDLFVARTADPVVELRALAAQDRMGVVNAMSAEEHPTQALTDLSTMTQRFGRVDGLRVLYVGEGNNSAAALALALSRFTGTRLYLRTPPGYGVDRDILSTAEVNAKRTGSAVVEAHHMSDLPEVDVVYTTRWQTTGTSKPDADWRRIFAPFQVDADVLASSPRAVFMHDLPAHRGEEVTADVLDGPRSIAFDQAEHKLFSAQAVLEWCAG